MGTKRRFGESCLMRAAGLELNKRDTSLFNGLKKGNEQKKTLTLPKLDTEQIHIYD